MITAHCYGGRPEIDDDACRWTLREEAKDGIGRATSGQRREEDGDDGGRWERPAMPRCLAPLAPPPVVLWLRSAVRSTWGRASLFPFENWTMGGGAAAAPPTKGGRRNISKPVKESFTLACTWHYPTWHLGLQLYWDFITSKVII